MGWSRICDHQRNDRLMKVDEGMGCARAVPAVVDRYWAPILAHKAEKRRMWLPSFSNSRSSCSVQPAISVQNVDMSLTSKSTGSTSMPECQAALT